MKAKRKITRILIALLWVVLSAALTVLLVAAIGIKNRKTCKDVKIEISGAKDFFFLNKHDILQLISENGKDQPVGKQYEAFDLQALEARLEKNVWIRDAKLFFDNNIVLHASIYEREPVARVFDRQGASFYIDSTGFNIPLGTKRITRLPVFTGYPFAYTGHASKADSQLIRHMQGISSYIVQDSFWMAQIAQIDITDRNTFEMVPTIGSHLIEFGNGEQYERKFNRLFQFYKQVLGKYGFDRYTKISVEFDSQVVATKRGPVSRIDSIQAMKNLQKIIEEVKEVTSDTLQGNVNTGLTVMPAVRNDSAVTVQAPAAVKPVKKPPVKPPVPVKPVTVQKPKAQNPADHATKPKANTTGVKPKAVMPRMD